MNRFISYLQATRVELTHVSWPTQKQAIIFTVLVLVISALTGVYLGFFDFLFTSALGQFLL